MPINIVFQNDSSKLPLVPTAVADEFVNLEIGEEFEFPEDFQAYFPEKCKGRFKVIDWIKDKSRLKTEGKQLVIKRIK